MNYAHGTVPTTSPSPSIEQPSEPSSSPMNYSGTTSFPLLQRVQAFLTCRICTLAPPIQACERNTSRWSKLSNKRAAKRSSSQVCTSPANACTFSPSLYYLSLMMPTELNQLTGIAAILTYPLDVEVVEAEEAVYNGSSTSEAVTVDEPHTP